MKTGEKTVLGLLLMVLLVSSSVWAAQVYHVDVLSGNDLNAGLSKETAFKTIQKGIDTAVDSDTVLVWPGVYEEQINFLGKAITVKSAADAAIMQTPEDFAVSFYGDEDSNSVLQNFIIRDSYLGIFIVNASPTIKNLTVINNDSGIELYGTGNPDISNCIFYNNIDGDLSRCEAKYSYVQSDNMEGLVSYWKLDDGSGIIASDSQGSNVGTIVGAAWTTGQVGSALTFDGVDDYVDLGNSSSLKQPLPVTISAWIKLSVLGQHGQIVGLGEQVSTYSGIFLEIFANNALVLSYGDGGPQYSQNRRSKLGTTALEADRWYHVTAVIRGATDMSLYINGIDDGGTYSGTGGRLVYSSTGHSCLGICMGRHEGLDLVFDGAIDEVSVYNQALAAKEIEGIYHAGLNGRGLDSEPLFADADNGDYHLLSQRGRYWPEHDIWVLDKVTSPCIDDGNPNENPMGEPMPNGGRIDMGAFGGTAYASMSEWRIKGDINRNGICDFADFTILTKDWLEKEAWKN